MILESPIGTLRIATDEAGRLTRVHFVKHPEDLLDHKESDAAHVVAQLREYFAGERRTFDLELAPQGTPFQLAVWNALCEIPYGDTVTYAEIARRIGRPNAVRAVGAANGANPIPVIVPCHRVIGSNGTLTGYGGGIDRKQFLLALEGRRLF
ncbi:MAG TPA: methylated-DNA--[protein]-cysteine S-methyltransferase [Thermoanaerobaculia bacterium]|jgi:methylated-DNA-[protein]-cysteine S-methyltransferase